ncbi:MAG: TIGR02757 family protein [Nitrospirae bacterium]|nr:TIGR02757 family protein [Nitrospirota bacterium]
MRNIKRRLERFYSEFDFAGRINHDPIEFPHSYRRPEDIEAAGFIAGCLAYGRVDLFKAVVRRILLEMKGSPHDFLLEFNPKKHGKLFAGIKYRFNENEDIVCLLHFTGEVLKRHKSIEGAFMAHYRESDADIGIALAGFTEYLLGIDTSGVYGSNIRPKGLVQFFPSPAKGSACKRMNLFLRWMIRDRDIDFGIWKGIPKGKLVMPLDTHIAKISRCLGFTKRKTQDWRMAVEITDALREFDPEDPVKYDFAMCHQGISGLCNPKSPSGKAACRKCALKNLTSS